MSHTQLVCGTRKLSIKFIAINAISFSHKAISRFNQSYSSEPFMTREGRGDQIVTKVRPVEVHACQAGRPRQGGAD